jgi:hypothetical protein
VYVTVCVGWGGGRCACVRECDECEVCESVTVRGVRMLRCGVLLGDDADYRYFVRGATEP